MAYNQNSSYSAPRRNYYAESQPQQYARQDQYAQQGYGQSYNQQYNGAQPAVDQYSQNGGHAQGYAQQQRGGQDDRQYGQQQGGYASNDHAQQDQYAYEQQRTGYDQHNGGYSQQVNGYAQQHSRPSGGHEYAQQQNDQHQPARQTGYAQQNSQAQPYDERRYDPRYQQRNNEQQHQPDPRQQTISPPRTAQRQQSPQYLQPQKTAPKKMSMEEWKAQEKARMHKAANRPETLPQDNAFPTFPTKKEISRGQSAMSSRSGEDRPSTAASSRHDERRPGTSRENSYKRDYATDSARPSFDQKVPSINGSSRPSIDSQHRPFAQPDRRGSPLNDGQGSTMRMPPPRKDSYTSTSSIRSPPPNSSQPLAIDTSHTQHSFSSQQPQSPRDITGASDQRYARRPSEPQPMSPLGKFSQSAVQPPPQSHASLTSAIDDVYQGYSDISRGTNKPANPLTREEEIEAEMPDFSTADPNKQSDNDAFDFGFSGQTTVHPTANDYADLISGPFAAEPIGRTSIESARTLPYRTAASSNRPVPQRTYDDPRSATDRQAVPAPWANPAIQRPGSAPPDRPDVRTGSSMQNCSNPDALPAHPTPVRPGLMANAAPTPRPAPVRNYDIGRGTSQPQPQQIQQVQQQHSRPASGESDTPVTHTELQRLKADVDANPNSSKLVLQYAKKLVEAAKVLSNENGRTDPKVAAKQRERWLMEAYKRVKKLASAGYPDAQFYLADCYGQGLLGLEKDPKEAFKYYQSAAKAGHATAAYRTAVCCEMGAEDGGGTSKDYPRAVQWYKRAAALGDTAAMFKCGMISLKGLLGQPRHLGEAVIWLKRAAERADKDNPHALYELGVLYESAKSTPETRQKVIPDDAYALQLYRQAANLGSRNSQFRLGQAYEYGNLNTPIDHRTSISWYSKAAAQGQQSAELALSGWYLTGAPGILEANEHEAYLWAAKAAKKDPPNGQAMFALAYYLEQGIGVAVNTDEAKRWYSRAASFGHPKALERLEMMRKGIKGGYKNQSMKGKLSRQDQKRDEAECSVM